MTNATRERYIRDYIVHLTNHSIAPQYAAFARGVHATLHPRALRLFTPRQLQDLIEGQRNIDIDDLEQHATYEEFDENDPYVKGFWEVVREEAAKDEEWAGQLLEFVLASARVPVGGWGGAGSGQGRGSIVVQKNGEEWIDPAALNAIPVQVDGSADGTDTVNAETAAPTALAPAVTISIEDDNSSSLAATVDIAAAADDDASENSADGRAPVQQPNEQQRSPYRARLPSSSTCYARLLLPRYHITGEDESGAAGNEPGRGWKAVLRERLKKAVAEGRGFGML